MALTESVKLPITWQAANFSLPGIDDKVYSLDDLQGEKGLVVVFTCNHCPYARAAWPILIKLFQTYQSKGINFVAINPNDSQQYPEDSFKMMKVRAKEWEINFPYLRDKNQTVAKDYQAMCTPDVYLFDKDLKLYYHGRINDNWQDEEKVTREDLKDALDKLLADSDPPSEQFPSMGCSIKWL